MRTWPTLREGRSEDGSTSASRAPRVYELSRTLIVPSVLTPMRNGSAVVVIGRHRVGCDNGSPAGASSHGTLDRSPGSLPTLRWPAILGIISARRNEDRDREAA